MNTKMYQLGERKYYEMIQELGILSYFFEKTGWSKIYKFFKFLINLTYKMYWILLKSLLRNQKPQI